MSLHPIAALKGAVRTALLADAALVTLLGGADVFDEPPRGASPPYLVFGEASCRDRSGDGGPSHETLLAVTVWSRQGGSAEALAVAARAAAVLDDAALTLAGHRLVGLRVVATETKRPDARDTWRALIRLRAFTEPTL